MAQTERRLYLCAAALVQTRGPEDGMRLAALEGLLVGPWDVSLAAWARWGRSLTDQRDLLAAERMTPDGPAPDRVRAVVSRELVAELLGDILDRKGRK